MDFLEEEELEQEDTAPHPSHCSFQFSRREPRGPGEHLEVHAQECGPVKLNMS